MLLVCEIDLPEDQDAEAFATFMRDEYLPAVHKGPTRVGQVEHLELLRHDTEDGASSRFTWAVRWSGLVPRGVITARDDAVLARFEAFGATFTEPAALREVAVWPDPSAPPPPEPEA